MNKEVNDALHTLLNLSLKDKSFSTQKQQFKIVYDYITNLQEENERLKKELVYKYETQRIMRDANGREYELILTRRVNLGEMYEDYKSRCEKGLDKLYCYGEIFDSKILQEFQKEMINTLTGGDKE